MSLDDPLLSLTTLIDRAVADPAERDAAKLDLLRLRGTTVRSTAAIARAPDRWTGRARPMFLYVMYALLLWAIPVGLLAAIRPGLAAQVAGAMAAYLDGIPEPLYALFGTGYLGYTAARTWGKAKGVER